MTDPTTRVHRGPLKLSQFLKDLLGTGVAQFAILGLSMLLVRIVADLVTEEHFGVFMVVRRLVGVLAPITSLNLGIGLARYLSYQPDQRHLFVSSALWIMAGATGVAVLVMVAAAPFAAESFFGSAGFADFVVVLGITLLATNVVGLVSDVYRGRVEMAWANAVQVMSFVVPLALLPVAWLAAGGNSRGFLLVHLALTGLGLLAMGWAFFRIGPAWSPLLGPACVRADAVRSLVGYSVSRVPSSFLLGLVFALPVLVVSRSGSLELAARVGILATLVRLMETWSYPFNLIVLPRFAGLRSSGRPEALRSYTSIVLDFVVGAVPLIGALSFGMAGVVVHLAFGRTYLDVAPSASWILVASTAYVAFVLIRGVLDGLHGFPYVNVVSIVGLIAAGASMLGLGTDTITDMSVALAASMLAMGGFSVVLLVQKCGASVGLWSPVAGAALAVAGFAVAGFFDRAIQPLEIGVIGEAVVQTAFRIALLGAVFWGYWRKRSAWGRAVWDRVLREGT